MKKITAIILIISAIFITSCVKKESQINVGFSGGLTGKYSQLGVSSMYGTQLAVDEINNNGGINGKKINLIIKDDKNTPEIGLKTNKELFEEDVVAVIGHLTSSMVELVPFYNENEKLLISPTMSTGEVNKKDDYLIRMLNDNKMQAEKLAETIYRDNNEDIAILSESLNEKFSSEFSNKLINHYEKLGGEIVKIEQFKCNNLKEFLEIAKRYKKANIKKLVIIGPGYDIASFSQAFKAINHDVKIYSSFWTMTSDIFYYGRSNVENVVFTNIINYESKNKNFLEFTQKYEERYNSIPSFASYLSYEAVYVLADALKNADSFKSSDLKEYIVNKKSFNGLQNKIFIDQYGDTDREVYNYEIIDGRFRIRK